MGVITALAIAGMASAVYITRITHGEAGAVNMAGSLRMQSYRLTATLEAAHPPWIDRLDEVSVLTEEFEQRLNSPKLADVVLSTDRASLQTAYRQIKIDWKQTMLPLINEYVHQVKEPFPQATIRQTALTFRVAVDNFVSDIDQMVRLLEEDAESKIHLLGLMQSISLMFTLTVAVITIYLLHTDVLSPMRDLLQSAERAGRGDFSVRVGHTGTDELGRLGKTFNTMTEEISKMYGDLERRVAEKTKELTRRNRSLELLYDASQHLTQAAVSETTYLELLEEIGSVVESDGIKLCLSDDEKELAHAVASCGSSPFMCKTEACDICLGDGLTQLIDDIGYGGGASVLSIPVRDPENHYGVLLLIPQRGSTLPPWQIKLLETLGKHIGISIGVTRRITQRRRLALLDERSAIARELHDSLAQSLSYLKIQVTRLSVLRKSGADDQQIDEVQNELKDGLDSAYLHLRELLTTFRLQMNGRGMAAALSETVSEFNARNEIEIVLDNQLKHFSLSVNQEIHLLQIVRESLANVVHHSQADQASVIIQQLDNHKVQVRIEDNGIGIPSNAERTHHYGLAIMHERASSLNGELFIQNRPEGGTCIMLMFRPNGSTLNVVEHQEQAVS
ncbi:MAG: type IV pili methyl-accepting chemotaxis transducer N-terminal domain-containing protein [Candidatus Sedimenticola sp. (ex Thyasira tokunagai)]